jgi:hypothetical protein
MLTSFVLNPHTRLFLMRNKSGTLAITTRCFYCELNLFPSHKKGVMLSLLLFLLLIAIINPLHANYNSYDVQVLAAKVILSVPITSLF